jgi:hypothetical protein
MISTFTILLMAQVLRAFSRGFGGKQVAGDTLMNWNQEPITYEAALQIGWNLPMDVVGAGVYGGIVKRDEDGRVIIGDEWPEDNLSPPAHNPVHPRGPYLDFSQLTSANRGYTHIARILQNSRGSGASELERLFQRVPEADRKKLANLVMAGGARPLHMCGMGRGGDTSELIKVFLKYGAEVNAKDNYEYTPMDRLASNNVAGNNVLKQHGGVRGRQLPRGQPQWDSDEYSYRGLGEADMSNTEM